MLEISIHVVINVSCLLLWCYESVGYYHNTTQATYHCWHDLKLGVAMIWALLHWPCVFQQFAEITNKKIIFKEFTAKTYLKKKRKVLLIEA